MRRRRSQDKQHSTSAIALLEATLLRQQMEAVGPLSPLYTVLQIFFASVLQHRASLRMNICFSGIWEVWQHPEKAPGIMSGGGGILSYHVPGSQKIPIGTLTMIDMFQSESGEWLRDVLMQSNYP